MDVRDLVAELVATLDDGVLSRTERRALAATLEERPLDDGGRALVSAALFEAATEKLHDPRDRPVLAWLEGCLKAIQPRNPGEARAEHRAWFGPEDPLADVVAAQVRGARHALDAAVFTITDDRIHDALLDAWRRGVRVRVISDVAKAEEPGSDVYRLQRAGVPVVTDRSPAWFHHKFAVVDDRILLTGSYNWTRSGATENRENLLLTTEPALVRAYARAFDRLWREFAGAAETTAAQGGKR